MINGIVGDKHTVILIQNLHVDSKYQRQSIGTCLMEEVLSRYDHARQIQLCSDNVTASNLF